MKKHLFALLFILCASLPSFAQHREPVATNMDANGKMIFVDYAARDLTTPDPQHNQIQKAVIFDFQCIPTPTNPPPGNVRFYCDSGTGNMACLTSTGANCLGGGGGGGGGSVTSVGLAGPTGIPISNSPVTSAGTLTWSMPSGWVLGDLLVGNGSNSVARLAAPTTPDTVTEMLINTPSGGATLPQWALAGLAGRVVSTNSDTIIAADRTPQTIEYTFNGPTAITVPDPASTGFNGNPSFVTIAEGVGPYTFTPQTSAVIMYCDGSNCFDGQPSLTLQKGQYATWSSPTTSNWVVRVASTQPISQPPVVNGLISGGGVTWTGLLNFTCSAAQYAIAGTVYNSPQTNLTLSAADPTNPRIDVIAVNNSGACVAITGTPAGSPAAPSVDPTTQLSLTFVTIPANSTTPTLNSILVYDENSTPPTEYTCTPTANFNCNSTNNPFHLTHDIEATTAVATNSVTLVNSGTVNFSTYSTLSFNIRNKASWAAAKSLQICFLNSATIVGNCVGFKNGVYGFNQVNTTSYQQIVIPLSAFALGSTVADRVRFQVLGTGAGIGFYLDWIQIQSNLSGSGATGFQLQVNGQNTQPTTNIADNASVTWACTVAAGTTVSTCKATATGAPPSGTAGGDLSGTYPNPTVAQVNGAAVPTSAHVVGTNSSKQIIAATRTDVDAISYAAGGGTANAQTVTLSPAITAYTTGLKVCWKPSNANASTTPTLAVNGLTATTIIKVGGAALAASDLTTTAIACAIYDGTNFELQNPQTTTAAGITSINTSATGPAVTIQGVGATGVSTSGNTISISGGTTGNIAGTWGTISGNYTVVDSDNVNRLRFSSSAAAITLPQPGTITTDPFVAMRAQANMGAGGSPFTSSSFTTIAGHQMWITINANGTTTVSSVSLSTGDSCPQQSATTGANAAYVYFCPTLVGGGSVTISVTYAAGSASQIGLFAMELTGTTFDNAQTGISPGGFSNISLTNPIHFTNAVAIINQQNSSTIPPGFIEKDTFFNINTGSASNRLLSNSNSISTTSLSAIAFSQTIASISNHPAFIAGWQVLMENVSTGIQTVTSTSSTINGQTTLVLVPNEICTLQSNGSNWDAVCGVAPNVQFNGAIGNAIQVGYDQLLSRGSDRTITTIITTGASDAFYTVDADINCDSAVSTGVATLTITFTDPSNTVQTYSTNAACTTLGSSSISSIRQAFRAKASTAISDTLTHTGTQPTFDFSVAINQLSTK